MPTESEIIDQLTQLELLAQTSTDQLRNIERLYDELCTGNPKAVGLLRARNKFRIKHSHAMTTARPKVLLGLINGDHFPNFHTAPLLRVADVLSLTMRKDQQNESDRLYIDVFSQALPNILAAQYPQFVPDLYWDPQICGKSVLPLGLEKMPCITAAGLCHHHQTFEIENAAHLYDVLCPLSSRYTELFRSSFPDKVVLDLPFGLNWASFQEIVPSGPEDQKDIDILLTFSGGTGPEYGNYREECHKAFGSFKTKFGDNYKLLQTDNLSKHQYLDFLKRSKIVINAVGQHGPYNYRTCEIINAGAVLMQINTNYAVGDQYFERYFTPDEEVILFDAQTFEAKALQLLENPDRRQQICKQAQERLNSDYAYEKLYLDLFDAVKDMSKTHSLARLTTTEATKRRALSLFHSPREFKHLIMMEAIARAPEVLGISIEQAAIAYFQKIHLFSDTVISILFGSTKLVGLIKKQPAQALYELFQKIHDPCITDYWNLLIQKLQLGVTDTAALQELRRRLGESTTSNEELLGVHSLIYLPDDIKNNPSTTFGDNKFKYLSAPFLIAGDNPQQKDALIRDYMREQINTLSARFAA